MEVRARAAVAAARGDEDHVGVAGEEDEPERRELVRVRGGLGGEEEKKASEEGKGGVKETRGGEEARRVEGRGGRARTSSVSMTPSSRSKTAAANREASARTAMNTTAASSSSGASGASSFASSRAKRRRFAGGAGVSGACRGGAEGGDIAGGPRGEALPAKGSQVGGWEWRGSETSSCVRGCQHFS